MPREANLRLINTLVQYFIRVNDMLNNDELISVIFYLAGGRIRGLTRLQKIVSLAKMILDDSFGFESWIEDILKELEEKGLLKVYTEEPDLSYESFGEYSVRTYIASRDLIKRGREVFKELKMLDPIRAMYIKRLVRNAVNNVDLTHLNALIAYFYYKQIIK